MQFFRYKEDRVPTLIITVLFLFDIIVFQYVDNIWMLIVWMLVMLAPKSCICSWNHHHQHLPTFKQTIPNRFLEIIYAFHTGITTHAWVLHHVLGHHINYLDQTKDESAWKDSSGKTMGVFKYTLTVAATGYPRAYKVGEKFPDRKKTFIGMGTLVIILTALLLWYNWINALIIFVIPMLVGLIVTVWHTYYHHAGLDTDDEHEASYNIIHKWYNILTGNLGYHTAHHMKMGLHWSKLPEYHKSIESNIPKELYREPCIPFKWMPRR